MNEVRYPIYQQYGLRDRLALKAGFAGAGFCTVCDRMSAFVVKESTFARVAIA